MNQVQIKRSDLVTVYKLLGKIATGQTFSIEDKIAAEVINSILTAQLGIK